jgi:hypothetical protein
MTVLVCTHHKCASSFLLRYLQSLCEINEWSWITSHFGYAKPDPTSDLSFLRNATYSEIAPALGEHTQALHVIRNPLSVVASAYFSHLRTHPIDDWPQLASVDPRDGFHLTLSFLEQAEFYPRTPGPLRAMTDWDYDDRRFTTLRMEDIVKDVHSFGCQLIAKFRHGRGILPKADDFAFERFSFGRPRGVRDNGSHYRIGSSDAWKDDLPEDLVAEVRVRYSGLLTRFYSENC